MTERSVDHPAAAIRVLSLVWLGLVVGVSFVATPIKFSVGSLTRPVALEVGRATFHLLNRIELVLVLIMVAMAWWATATATAGRSARPIGRPAGSRPRLAVVPVLVAVVVTIVALQTVWLLPRLDERVAMIVAGNEPPPSLLHTIFGGLEVIKVATLGLLGHRAGRSCQTVATPAPVADATAQGVGR